MPAGCLELGDAEKDEQGDMKYEMEKNKLALLVIRMNQRSVLDKWHEKEKLELDLVSYWI